VIVGLYGDGRYAVVENISPEAVTLTLILTLIHTHTLTLTLTHILI